MKNNNLNINLYSCGVKCYDLIDNIISIMDKTREYILNNNKPNTYYILSTSLYIDDHIFKEWNENNIKLTLFENETKKEIFNIDENDISSVNLMNTLSYILINKIRNNMYVEVEDFNNEYYYSLYNNMKDYRYSPKDKYYVNMYDSNVLGYYGKIYTGMLDPRNGCNISIEYALSKKLDNEILHGLSNLLNMEYYLLKKDDTTNYNEVIKTLNILKDVNNNFDNIINGEKVRKKIL